MTLLFVKSPVIDTELQTDIGHCRNAEYYGSMSIDTIINGGAMPGCEEARFPGLIPLVYQYINTVEGVDVDTRCTISHYLKLISDRAAGKWKGGPACVNSSLSLSLWVAYLLALVIDDAIPHLYVSPVLCLSPVSP